MKRAVREAAETLRQEFGLDPEATWLVADEALREGLGVEEAARRLYAALGGRLPLATCRAAAARLPLRPRRTG